MCALVISGCDGISISPAHASRARTLDEPPGENCPLGGQAVQTGLDTDKSGQLDDTEVTSTTYVCATPPPPARTRVLPEPAGAHCEWGGQAVQTGLDLDGNGQLDAAEVTATEYLCASRTPEVLVRSRSFGPDARCANGGQETSAGMDTNADGQLAESEVTRTTVACLTPAPVLVRMSGTASPVSCVRDAVQVEAGPDTNANQVLDPTEVRAVTTLCDTSLNRVLARTRPEPPGELCAIGGTRVLVGEDRDGNGQLEDTEASAFAMVCEAAPTLDGTYVVRGPADLAALQGVARIVGGLEFVGKELTEVKLPALMTVEGTLSIEDTLHLERVQLPALRLVQGDITVRHNTRLESLELGPQRAPEQGPKSDWWVHGGLYVENNPSLASLGGMSFIVPRLSISVRNNANLRVPGELNRVENLQGELVLQDNPVLQGIPFPQLQTVRANVTVWNNSALPDLTGLDALSHVGGALNVRNNAHLRSLVGLGALDSVEVLQVYSNPELKTTQGLTSLSHARSLEFSANGSLEFVGDFPSLQSLDTLYVSGNATLVSITGLPRLQAINERLFLFNNPFLEGLKGLGGLKYVRALQVTSNASLTTLEPLRTLREVEELTLFGNLNLLRLDLGGVVRVSTTLSVENNPKLPTCLATTLAVRTYAGAPEQLYISGNSDDATACAK
ncbi:hypothetical protein DRW03_11605 [Corallococcus sp. H22C18031201]|nr:hypothetical protein DRW03_11605 [Corallococcus sp. H22C18031201]